MKLVLLESSSNLQAQHTICFELLKYFVCIFVKGIIMPINRTILKQLVRVSYQLPIFINLIWLESLLRVESNHHHGLVNWKPFKIHLKNVKENTIQICFVYLQSSICIHCPRFIIIILGTSWTNMEAPWYLFLQFHLSLVLERENGPLGFFIPFLSSLFKILFWFTFFS